jgi:hypothetical protein
MKTIAAILFAAYAMQASAAEKLFDDELAKNAIAVLRVQKVYARPLLNYPFTQYVVDVRQVFKNESNVNLNQTITVSAYKGQDGVPAEECTIYITRYNVANREFNITNGTIWMLVGGDATNGVSNVERKAVLR